ncbi:MAG: hypothetical protein ACRCWM_09865 [Sarcina sp.]
MEKILIGGIVSYVIWLILTLVSHQILKKYKRKFRIIDLILKILEVSMVISVVMYLYGILFFIFLSVFVNFESLLVKVFNEQVSIYLGMLITLVLAIYYGEETINLFTKLVTKVAIKDIGHINMIGNLLCRGLALIRIKILIYFIVILANIVSFMETYGGMQFDLLNFDNTLLLQITVTFIAIDCFVDKLRPEVKELKRDIKKISGFFSN